MARIIDPHSQGLEPLWLSHHASALGGPTVTKQERQLDYQ